MITWILTEAGLEPGYLIGGVPNNFSRSADLGSSPFFVIEADEYARRISTGVPSSCTTDRAR